jgi:hypothetical protein
MRWPRSHTRDNISDASSCQTLLHVELFSSTSVFTEPVFQQIIGNYTDVNNFSE